MKRRYSLVFMLVAFSSSLAISQTANEKWSPFTSVKTGSVLPSDGIKINRESITIEARGTGKTTGHIFDITVTNKNDFPIKIVPQTVYIPSIPRGRYQRYVGRIPEGMVVPPKSVVVIQGSGYCADISKPPVPKGGVMPPVADWVPVIPGGGRDTDWYGIGDTNGDGIPDNQISGAPSDAMQVVLINRPPVAGFTSANIPDIIASTIYSPAENTPVDGLIASWPDTEIPVAGAVDPEAGPEVAASIFVAALDKIEEAFSNIKGSGGFFTPISSRPEDEKEAIIQQTFWIFTSDITGAPYTQEDFTEKAYEQFENAAGFPATKLNEAQKDNLDAGLEDFWGSFALVGVQAKVLTGSTASGDNDPLFQITFDPQGLHCGNCISAPELQLHIKTTSCKINCSDCLLTDWEKEWLKSLEQLYSGQPFSKGRFNRTFRSYNYDRDYFCKSITRLMERILAMENRSPEILHFDALLDKAWKEYCLGSFLGPVNRDVNHGGRKDGSSTMDVHQRTAPLADAPRKAVSEALYWPDGICVDSPQELQNLIKRYAYAEGRIRRFTWTGHGGEKEPCSPENPIGIGNCVLSIGRGEGVLTIDRLSDMLRTHTEYGNCEIIIRACYLGNPECKRVMQNLANKTGCIVRAPQGATKPVSSPDDTWTTYFPEDHHGPIKRR